MGLGGILILLLLLVSLVVFIYVLVQTARGWGVLHSILLSFLFIECWVFIVFSAGVHSRRVGSTEQAFKAREEAATATQTTQQLLYGEFGVSPEALDAVVPVRGQLRRMTADRGRVWRQANLVQANPGAYQLELSTATPSADPLAMDPAGNDAAGNDAAAAAAQPSSESLPQSTVVYAFAETTNEAGQPLPSFYLGEFTVAQSQAGQVTLEPTLPLDPSQMQQISEGNASSWTLYELMPLDGHETFAAPGSQPADDQIFGRMDEETLRSLGLPDDLISAYLRDGQQASDDDPIEHVWIQVNMLKDYELDVDSQEVANATERGYFDATGRSIDSRLKRHGDGRVQITPETKVKRIVLKAEVARQLIDNGVAELVQRIYVRPLNDYEEAFNQLLVRSHDIEERSLLYQRDSEEISKANQLGQEMISFRQVENQELREDLEGYQKEIDLLTSAVAEATEQVAQQRAELSRLYRQVQARREEIARQQVSVASFGAP
ncbi:MAG: hypothetical protein KDA45_11435 [Planctomycetales bacterium]|nr:hypothetical protein [Planctomycetales bacterium]